jgi:hypothetical protein
VFDPGVLDVVVYWMMSIMHSLYVVLLIIFVHKYHFSRFCKILVSCMFALGFNMSYLFFLSFSSWQVIEAHCGSEGCKFSCT